MLLLNNVLHFYHTVEIINYFSFFVAFKQFQVGVGWVKNILMLSIIISCSKLEAGFQYVPRQHISGSLLY